MTDVENGKVEKPDLVKYLDEFINEAVDVRLKIDKGRENLSEDDIVFLKKMSYLYRVNDKEINY